MIFMRSPIRGTDWGHGTDWGQVFRNHITISAYASTGTVVELISPGQGVFPFARKFSKRSVGKAKCAHETPHS